MAISGTTTSLTVTPASPTVPGTVATLTASVKETGGATVGTGTILFYDSFSPALPFAQAQITSAGTAVVRRMLAAGTHKFTAKFVATMDDAASTSPAQTLVVPGNQTYPTEAEIFQNTSNGDSIVSNLMLYGAGAPTGTVQVKSQDTGLVLGSGTVTATDFQQQQPIALNVSNASTVTVAVVAGDFNTDGLPDIAAVEADNKVAVYLNLGGGKFAPAVEYAVGNGPAAIVAGDFNADGKLDLAITNTTDNTVSLLRGIGDGTFMVQTTIATGAGPLGIVVADTNRDGKLDLVVVDSGSVDGNGDSQLEIFAGNGDGTFAATSAKTILAGGSQYAAVGDLNGDGIPDTAVTQLASTTEVLLGNPDGTFQAGTYLFGSYPMGQIVIADLNNDGFHDIVATSASIDTYIYLGKGDGTFPTATEFSTDAGSGALVVADFNNDGILDIGTANNTVQSLFNDSFISVYFGQGAGGVFSNSDSAGLGAGTVNYPVGIVAADFNGDGLMDLASAGSNPQIDVNLGYRDGVATVANVTVLQEDHLIGTYIPGTADPYAGSVSDVLPTEPPAAYFSLAFGGNVTTLSSTAGTATAPLTVIVLDDGAGRNTTAAFPITLTVVGPDGVPTTYNQTTVNGATIFTLPAYTTAGTYTITAFSASAEAEAPPTITLTVSPGVQTATKLFLASPYPVHASKGVSSGVTVAVLDQNGNPDLAFAGTVTLSTTDHAAVATPVAHTFAPADSGVYTFQLAFNTPGAQSLTFSSTGLNPVTESGIAVLPASTTTLSYSATPVQSLTPVALQATVTVAGTLVTRGTVNFYDADASPRLIATVQLNASGVASINKILGVGTHPITAVYTGTTVAGASTSAPQVLTVTPGGNYETTGLLSGGTSEYDIYDVIGFVGGAAPTGSIQFIDTNHNNLVLATEVLGSPSYTFTVNTLDTPVGIAPYLMVKGDFNGDGVPDVAVVNSNATDNTVSVLLGNLYGGAAINADGTTGAGSAYQQPLIYAVGNRPVGIVVGDFNSDGKQDLAVANSGDNTVSVLLGNGDGTFQPALTFAVGTTPIGLAAGDVDADGNLDLLVTNSGDNTLSLLRGTGDGTFQTQSTIAAGAGPQNVVLADFNGDSVLDFAVTNGLANSVMTMLGNGDGTFRSPQTLSGGGFPYALMALDVASTGKVSLAASNLNGSSVSFYKGNGDGTFLTPTILNAGSMPVSMTAADFYNQGYLDLVVADSGEKTSSIYIFYGDADGNLGLDGAGTIDPIGPNPQGVVAADVYTDGLSALVVSGKSQGNQYDGQVSRPAISVLPIFQTRLAEGGLGAVGLNDSDEHTVVAQYVPGAADPYVGSYSDGLTVPGVLLESPGLSQLPSGPFTAGVVPPAIVVEADKAGALDTSYTGPLTLTVVGLNVTYSQTYTKNAIAGKIGFGIPAFQKAGTYRFLIQVGNGVAVHIINTDTQVVAASAATLVVTTPFISPAARGVSDAFGVTVKDAFGNTVTTYTGTVAVTTSDLAAVVRPASHTFISNDAGFTSFAVTFNTAGTQSITASAKGLTSAVQSNIAVIAPQLTTTTTLSFSPSSPQPAKTPVTLTASVVDSTNTPVALGVVNFYDTAAAAPNLIASAPLSVSGVASVKFNFPVGTHSITATFQPKNADQGSTSGSQTLVITAAANYLTQTTLATTGSPAAYKLNAAVGALGVIQPTGHVSFVDTSKGNAVVGTITLGTGVSAFVPQVTYATGDGPGDTVQADFNGDGKADVAVLNTNDGTATILPGNGDGTFGTATTIDLGVYSPSHMASGDFNSDGKVDLAIIDTDGSFVVLLGNGDGTFQAPLTTGGLTNSQGGLNDSNLSGLALGDFNRDGKLDVAVSNSVDGTILVLLGYGDGTFQQPVFYAGETGPEGLAVTDLNGDGYPDLVVANSLGGTVSVLIGNGDGTFGNQAAYAVDQQPTQVAIADFNGDGKVDVIATNESGGDVSVLLGKGDGTFLPAINTASGQGPTNILTGDFNADGKQDAVVINEFDNTAALLLGKGDGTFLPAVPFTTGATPSGLAAGDFTASGRLSIAVANMSDSTVSILLGEEIYPASLTGFSFPGAGLHAVEAVYNVGVSDAYASSISATVNLYGNGTPIPTVTMSSSKNPSTLGASVTLTAALSSSTAGNISGVVTFFDGTTMLGTSPVNSGAASIATSALTLGAHSVTAVYAGNSTYANATSAAFSQVVGAVATTSVTISSSQSPTITGHNVTFTAAVHSAIAGTPSGTVTFFSDGASLGTGTLNASAVTTFATTTLAMGSHTITAVYGGDANYQTATSPAITQTVTKQVSTTLLSASATMLENEGLVNFSVTVSGNAGTPTGTVSFSDGTFTLGTATLNSQGVATTSDYFDTLGAHNIVATYLGDTTYGGSASPAIIVTVSPPPQTTVTIAAASATYVLDSDGVTINVTVTGGDHGIPTGNVSVVIGGVGNYGTLDATGKVSIMVPNVTSGANYVTASYGGDNTYQASTSAPLIVYGTDVVQDPILILQLSKDPGLSGQPEKFSVSVHTVSGPTPTGTVTLTDQYDFNPTETLATLALDASGTATFTTSALNVSDFHEAVATYNGDSNYTAGIQDTAYFEIDQGPTQPTTTTVTVNPNPSPVGGAVTLTAKVTSQLNLVPTGNVTFYDGSRLLGSEELNGSATTSFTISSLPSGAHSISAAYDGDDFYSTSVGFASAALIVGSGKTASTTTLASSLNPSLLGQAVTFTASVTGVGDTPSGSVTLMDGANTLGTANLSGGAAVFTTSALAVASHSITVSYSGDNTFAASASLGLTQVVNVAANGTTTILTASVNPANAGQSVILTATVAATAAGAGVPTGTVTFLDGQTALGTGNLNAGGNATLRVTLAVGSHNLTASYAGAGTYPASTSALLVEVISKAATTTALVSSAVSVPAGTNVTFTATVTSTYSGVATGTVTFSDGATIIGSGTLNAAGVATYSTATLVVGLHSITAVYGADSTYAGSTSNNVTETITQATTPVTTTVLSASPNPALILQSVTLSAAVTSTTSGTITGSVTFFDGSNSLGQGTAASGVAVLSTTALAAGPHSLTAVYAGTSSYSASTSSAVVETINKVTSSLVLTSSLNPSVSGQSVTFTATVAPMSSGLPTGSVTFFDGVTSLATIALNGAGTASYTTSILSIASHQISAVYTGDTTYLGSTSPTLTQVVSKAPLAATTIALLSSINPSSTLQNVTFTAAVTSTVSGTPTGSITFFDGVAPLGTVALNGSASASFSTATLTAGSHIITAMYAGDSSFNQATSSALTQVVNKLVTTTTLITSLTPAPTGQPVTFTATIKSSSNGTPRGSISFLDGTTLLGTVAANASGLTTFTTSALSVGSHNVTAVYGADANYAASTSAVLVEVISATATSTILTTTPNPSNAGQAVSFSATVSASTGTPSGSVNFFDGSNLLGSATPNLAGVATFATSTQLPGQHALTAMYVASGSLGASTSPVVLQTVNKAASATVLTVSGVSAYTGQPVVLTATVSSSFAGTATGTVSFYDGLTLLGTGTLGASGTATYTITALAVGTHTLSAVYAGDTNYLSSTSNNASIIINTDYTVSAPVATQVVNPGYPAAYSISVAPVGGSYSGAVTFTTDGLPAGARATFSPATVSPGSGPAVSVLIINTTGLVAANRSTYSRPRAQLPFAPVLLAALLLPLAGLRRSRQALARYGVSTMARAIIIVAALVVATVLSGCGSGGFFQQPAKSYNVTVTGSSGTLQHSTTITLTVE